MAIITISREEGSLSREIAAGIAESYRTGVRLYFTENTAITRESAIPERE